jgi:hypothetical protein
MSSYKVEQRRLQHRDRQFHFVSYQGQPADARKGEPATPDMWYLINNGKRHAVIPQVHGQDEAELDEALLGWIDEHIYGTVAKGG